MTLLVVLPPRYAAVRNW